ncbi:hypothetical protein [Ferruginibacter sp.]
MSVNAQQTSISAPDSGIASVITSVKQLVIPAQLQAYASVQFMDVRHFKNFAGFIVSKDGKDINKLTTGKKLEDELNQAEKTKMNEHASDSIFVVLKNFWFNKSGYEKRKNYCSVSALFFIKQKDSFCYDYRVDTVFAYKDPFGEFHKTAIDKVINDLLALYKEPGKHISKKYGAAIFYANAEKKRPGPVPVKDSMGVFLTYKDFLNGNLYKIPLSVTAFFKDFTFRIENEELNTKLHRSIWGLVYQGELYIKTGNFLNKAFPYGETYITTCSTVIKDNGHILSHPYWPYNYYDESNMGLTEAATAVALTTEIADLLHHKNGSIKYYPAILDIETGRLQ